MLLLYNALIKRGRYRMRGKSVRCVDITEHLIETPHSGPEQRGTIA
jgi:hypothetical protein